MSKHWERDLDNLQRHLMALATAVEEAIFKGTRALQERNSALAAEVVAGDSVIDQVENHVENECLKMLALHQPVAIDLRRIIAALKINTDLERMADLAVNIAERALSLAELPRIAVPDKLQRMTDLTIAMVRQSLDAFVMLEAEQARRVIRLDDEVDRYNREIIAELIRYMQQTPELVPAFMAFFSAVRQLERIADHATNIAEDVVYLIEGEIIRHLPMPISERAKERGYMKTILQLGPVDHGRPLTLEEFHTARWQSGHCYELIHGKLYASPVADLPQNWLELWLFGKLNLYVLQRPDVVNFVTNKARVFVPEEPEATQPEPDLAAYQDFPRDLPLAHMNWRNVSPLLVVEVMGANDPDKDLERNVELYLQVPSIREYWIVDPLLDADNPTLLVYRRRGRRWQRPILVSPGETYTTRLLPGFALLIDPHT